MRKSVTLNGENIKVEFSKEILNTTEIYKNDNNREVGNLGMITEGLTNIIFNINNKQYDVELKSYYRNTKKGLKYNQCYFYNNISLGDSEKKVIEYILS